MRIYIFFFASFFLADTKEAVFQAQEVVQHVDPASIPAAKLKLAKALYRDQNQEESFKTFLDAIDQLPNSAPTPMSPDEAAVYDKALKVYLNGKSEDASKTSDEILKIYQPLLKEHPDWGRLGFLIALAQANKRQFEPFYDQFYLSYQQDPQHFLAWKTKAILHLKLFERAKTETERAHERSLLLSYLRKAEEAYPFDYTLYKMQIAFSQSIEDTQEKEALKLRILNKIPTLSMMPSRGDTLYFMKLAQLTGNKELLARWCSQAKEWYPDSRSLQQFGENGNQNAR